MSASDWQFCSCGYACSILGTPKIDTPFSYSISSTILATIVFHKSISALAYFSKVAAHTPGSLIGANRNKDFRRFYTAANRVAVWLLAQSLADVNLESSEDAKPVVRSPIAEVAGRRSPPTTLCSFLCCVIIFTVQVHAGLSPDIWQGDRLRLLPVISFLGALSCAAGHLVLTWRLNTLGKVQGATFSVAAINAPQFWTVVSDRVVVWTRRVGSRDVSISRQCYYVWQQGVDGRSPISQKSPVSWKFESNLPGRRFYPVGVYVIQLEVDNRLNCAGRRSPVAGRRSHDCFAGGIILTALCLSRYLLDIWYGDVVARCAPVGQGSADFHTVYQDCLC